MDTLRTRPNDETTFVPKAPGAFDRGACKVQHWIDREQGDFPPEPGRYHLFLNYGCGWCHQLLLVRSLRGLQDTLSVTHVGGYRLNPEARGTPEYRGFGISETGANDTSGCSFSCLRDVYNADDGGYGTDQLTIPVLFDKRTRRVVSNDPAQMHLMLDHWAAELGGKNSMDSAQLYPQSLQAEIEAANAVVFPKINNGVYCCWIGAMGPQGLESPAFLEGLELVQQGLQWMEERLKEQDFLCADRLTLADVRAFPHLIRFDLMYHKLMLHDRGERIFGEDSKFPRLQQYLKQMFAVPEVYATCDLQFATRFYFSSMPWEASDELYDTETLTPEKGLGWLGSREEWTAKRQAEGLGDDHMMKPQGRV